MRGPGRTTLKRQAGLTLIELMVAAVIGIVVSVAALSSVQTFDIISRSQAGAGSAQAAGVAALGTLKHDLQMAGLGFFSDGRALCPTLNAQFEGRMLSNGAPFQPALIRRMADGTDELELAYASTVLSGAASRTLSPMASAMGNVDVALGAGIQNQQTVVLAAADQAQPCTLATVSSSVLVGTRRTLEFSAPVGFNPPDWAAAFGASSLYPTSSLVANLGQVTWRAFRVQDATLFMRDLLTNTQTPLVEGVLQMRLQYGLAATPTESAVSQWVNAAGNAPLSALDQQRLRAVRMGLLTVNEHREHPIDGSCTATVEAPELWPGEAARVDLQPEWRCHRFRVYGTVVALRNMQWGGQ